MELMVTYKFCYQIQDSGEYIVPQLLGNNPPNGFDPSKAKSGIQVVMDYKGFLPRGVLTQLTVSMHGQISGGQRHACNAGFGLIHTWDKDTIGLVEESLDAKKIHFYASGPMAAALMHNMLYEAERINKEFRISKLDLLVPCPCAVCASLKYDERNTFNLETLLTEYHKNGQNKIRCYKLDGDVSISLMLEGVVGLNPRSIERDEKIGFGLGTTDELLKLLIARLALDLSPDRKLDNSHKRELTSLEENLLVGRWRAKAGWVLGISLGITVFLSVWFFNQWWLPKKFWNWLNGTVPPSLTGGILTIICGVLVNFCYQRFWDLQAKTTFLEDQRKKLK